jgi:UDPglucose 6-dehydrogenase
VLVTEWAEFLHLDWAKVKDLMRRPLIIDGRNALDGETLTRMGFVYEGIGIPNAGSGAG